MRILQICNVGQICGGTAACAHTITRALPEHDHHVIFRNKPTPQTTRAFEPATTAHHQSPFVIDYESDLVIAHNSPAGTIRTRSPLMAYIHSARQTPETGDHHVYCSHWLARQLNDHNPGRVLHQGVELPEPLPSDHHYRHVIGRICTPTRAKWPRAATIDFYTAAAYTFPAATWHFVGCPDNLKPDLLAACGNALFIDAHPQAKAWLHRWTATVYHNPHLTESFGRTCAEAMLAGCIPIVPPTGGFAEQIPNDPEHFPWRQTAPGIDKALDALHRVLNATDEQLESWRADATKHAATYALPAFRHRLNRAIKATIKAHATRHHATTGPQNSHQ